MEIATSDMTDEAITAIADPVARARALRDIAKANGTLTYAQSRIYDAAVAEMRGDGERKQTWIARRLGVSRQKVSVRLRRYATETEAAA